MFRDLRVTTIRVHKPDGGSGEPFAPTRPLNTAVVLFFFFITVRASLLDYKEKTLRKKYEKETTSEGRWPKEYELTVLIYVYLMICFCAKAHISLTNLIYFSIHF
jgi:hypothetical protein